MYRLLRTYASGMSNKNQVVVIAPIIFALSLFAFGDSTAVVLPHMTVEVNESPEFSYHDSDIDNNDVYVIVGDGQRSMKSSDGFSVIPAVGLAIVFNASGDPVRILKHKEPKTGDQCGAAVALNTDYFIVGCRGRNSILVFATDNETYYEEVKAIGDNIPSYTFFGSSVAINHMNEIIVGALNTAFASSTLFAYNGTNWTNITSFYPNSERERANVAISSSYIAIGMPLSDIPKANSGRVYIYRIANASDRGSTWAQDEVLVSPNDQVDGEFGSSLVMTNERVIVGTKNENRYGGRVYIYFNNGTNWVLERQMNPPRDINGYGRSIGLNSDVLVVGANSHVYVYLNNGGVWSYHSELVMSQGQSFALSFGSFVSIFNGTVAAGYQVLNNDRAAAYLFLPFKPTTAPPTTPKSSASPGMLSCSWGIILLCWFIVAQITQMAK